MTPQRRLSRLDACGGLSRPAQPPGSACCQAHTHTLSRSTFHQQEQQLLRLAIARSAGAAGPSEGERQRLALESTGAVFEHGQPLPRAASPWEVRGHSCDRLPRLPCTRARRALLVRRRRALSYLPSV